MAWRVEYDEGALADLKKLDRQAQREILDYLDKRIGRAPDPGAFGEPLRYSKFGLVRYRWRDYRTLCQRRIRSVAVY